MAACSSGEIKQCTTVVKQMNDTSIVCQLDDYEIRFDTRKVEYTNGWVQAGDSVRISYVGDIRTKYVKAAIIHLIPRPGKVIEAGYDPSKKLETRPMNDMEKERMKTFVEDTKRLREKGGK